MSLFSAWSFSTTSWVSSDFLFPFLQKKQGGLRAEQDQEKLVTLSLHHAAGTAPRPPGAGGEPAGGVWCSHFPGVSRLQPLGNKHTSQFSNIRFQVVELPGWLVEAIGAASLECSRCAHPQLRMLVTVLGRLKIGCVNCTLPAGCRVTSKAEKGSVHAADPNLDAI